MTWVSTSSVFNTWRPGQLQSCLSNWASFCRTPPPATPAMPPTFTTLGLSPSCESSGHFSAFHLTFPCCFVHPRLRPGSSCSFLSPIWEGALWSSHSLYVNDSSQVCPFLRICNRSLVPDGDCFVLCVLAFEPLPANLTHTV